MSTMDLLKLMMALSGGFAEGNASDELEKLDDLLTEAGIPFENFGMQICYYGSEGRPKPKDSNSNVWQGPGKGAVCSVIANGHGSSEGLLEISGLMTREEMDRVHDTVLGHLTAEDVFARIRMHYESSK
ncbi:MAG TPA: hypothetical protein IAA26_14335 [Candidatus Blautia faecipullorum]|mgnify:CR=1 FL=1|nr:hypothetical protein [Candidatus Blautia faecipullorum]